MGDKSKTPDKMDLRSMDVSAENRAKLKQLFPSVVTETRNEKGDLVESIDFEKLKAELGKFSDVFESRRERYGMDWPGKKECMKLIQQQSIGTLKPCREESINFDTTENLFIEGDNLEVLKLLQKSYYGKVKMMYIDPPYNTGKEFIYPDNYSETLDTYLAYAGLVDDEGKKFSTNTPNEGRFHTKWLNMMYPRLYLAKNLLRDDGVIFISIGDDELENLKKLCNEIFGEENNIMIFSRMMKSGGAKGRFYTPSIDYIVVYAKLINEAVEFRGCLNEEQIERFYNKVETEGDRKGELYGEDRIYKASLEPRPNQRYYIRCPDGSYAIPPGITFPAKIVEGEKITPTAQDGVWKWIYNKYYDEKLKGNIVFKNTNTSALVNEKGKKSPWNIYNKLYLSDQKEKGLVPSNFIEEFENRQSSAELKNLSIYFDYAKPSGLIKYLISISTSGSDAIILDFFSGSCTTAHALLDLNKENNGNRKFIMVQLPEPCDENSEAFKAGYKTIADIGKERIRRVIKKIEEEQTSEAKDSAESLPGMTKEPPKLDLGFKVFKLDKSNFKLWDGTDPDISEEKLAKQLELHIEHINPKASQEDVLYELLLKAGFKPTEKVKKKKLAGKTVYSIADGALLICLENDISRELIDAVAEAEPIQFICLDRAFKGNDQLKANAVQTFEARNQGRDKARQIVFRTV